MTKHNRANHSSLYARPNTWIPGSYTIFIHQLLIHTNVWFSV